MSLKRGMLGTVAAMSTLSLLWANAARAEQVYAVGKVTPPVPVSKPTVSPVARTVPVSVLPVTASSGVKQAASPAKSDPVKVQFKAQSVFVSGKTAVQLPASTKSSAASPKVPVDVKSTVSVKSAQVFSGAAGINPVGGTAPLSGKPQGPILGGVKTSVVPSAIPSPNGQPATPALDIDLLRSVPLEVTGYASAQCLPPQLTSAQDVLTVLNGTPVLLVHMEALRRGYTELPAEERAKLLSDLHKRHMAKETDLMLGFDLGYAELVYEHNKTGLFFLRKANDHFQDQFSNLAYGMAQAEADITLENASPEELTTRKMDVMYRLGDAVKIDAAHHQPGFWPSYMHVLEKLKPMGAYKSFSRRDFSLAYVPYGNTVVPLRPAVNSSSSLSQTQQPGSLGQLPFSATVTPASSTAVCSPEAGTSESTGFFGSIVSQRTANFNGKLASIQFYRTADPHYRVRVVDSTGASLLTFETLTTANIVEDLDGDGVFEIVARQYQYDSLKPVLVYRYTACGFALDQKLSASFQ